MVQNCIQPIHKSLYRVSVRGRPVRLKPKNMSYAPMPSDEHRQGLTQVALDIFTDCVNVGVPFQDALLAIYLSGLDHGAEIMKEKHGAETQ